MIEITPLNQTIENYIPQSNWWYFHGKLQNDLKYDKGLITKGLNNNITYIYENKEVKKYFLNDGIYDVIVKGIKKPCIGYFWINFEEFDNVQGKIPILRGLVCYKDDLRAIEYAKSKYNEKAKFL